MMTKEEYDKQLVLIFEQKKALAKKFAFANNPYKIGDIVTDRIGSIKIDKILYSIKTSSSDYPSCIYEGIELTKKGLPNKKGNRRNVYQTNLLK